MNPEFFREVLEDYQLFPDGVVSTQLLCVLAECDGPVATQQIVRELYQSLRTAPLFPTVVGEQPMIVVGGHASFSGEAVQGDELPAAFAAFDGSNWLVNLEYQRLSEVVVFLAHIVALIVGLQKHPQAVGYFSGNGVRKEYATGLPTRWAEANTYGALCEHILPMLIPDQSEHEDILRRVRREPTAMGTRDNVERSVELYEREYQVSPSDLLLITWEFKDEACAQYFAQSAQAGATGPELVCHHVGIGTLTDHTELERARASNLRRAKQHAVFSQQERTEYYATREDSRWHLPRPTHASERSGAAALLMAAD